MSSMNYSYKCVTTDLKYVTDIGGCGVKIEASWSDRSFVSAVKATCKHTFRNELDGCYVTEILPNSLIAALEPAWLSIACIGLNDSYSRLLVAVSDHQENPHTLTLVACGYSADETEAAFGPSELRHGLSELISLRRFNDFFDAKQCFHVAAELFDAPFDTITLGGSL